MQQLEAQGLDQLRVSKQHIPLKRKDPEVFCLENPIGQNSGLDRLTRGSVENTESYCSSNPELQSASKEICNNTKLSANNQGGGDLVMQGLFFLCPEDHQVSDHENAREQLAVVARCCTPKADSITF